MNRSPIPEAAEAAGHLTPQTLPEDTNVSGVDRLLLALDIQYALGRQGASRREQTPAHHRAQAVKTARMLGDTARWTSHRGNQAAYPELAAAAP